MSSKIVLKVKFETTREKFEKLSENAYLVHLPFKQDSESAIVLKQILSKKIGAPQSMISYIGIDKNNNWIFEIR